MASYIYFGKLEYLYSFSNGLAFHAIKKALKLILTELELCFHFLFCVTLRSYGFDSRHKVIASNVSKVRAVSDANTDIDEGSRVATCHSDVNDIGI